VNPVPAVHGRRNRGLRRGGRAAPLVLAAALAAPLLVVALQAVADQWTGDAIVPQRLGWRGLRAVVDDPLVSRAVTNSMLVAALALAMALPPAWFAARALHETTGRARTVLVALLLAPLIVPQLAVGTGLTTWLLRLGLADSIPGVALAHLVYVLPYVTIALVPAFTPELRAREEAASLLGAGRLLRWWTVTLPASVPAVALAVALGFAVSWSQYGTSLAVGGGLPLLPLVTVPFVRADPQVGAALVLALLTPALVLAGAAALLSARSPALAPAREVP
jgi:putative spermidine/putrescine transport system permease protein